MYVWRILERHAPNFYFPVSCGIDSHWHIRRGRYCQVPRVSHLAPATVQSIRYGSFAERGPMLFNTLPSELRNMTNCSSESFKQALNTIPDEPQTPGYTCMRRAESNSLIHMIPLTTDDILQYRKSLTKCHKLKTHGHLGTEPGNHRQVSTSKYRQQEHTRDRAELLTFGNR